MRRAALFLCLGLLVPPAKAAAQEAVPLPPARPEAGDAGGQDRPGSQDRLRSTPAGQEKPGKREGPAAPGKPGLSEGTGEAGERSPGSAPAQPARRQEPATSSPTAEPPPPEPEGIEKIDVPPDLACRERLRNLGVTFETVEPISEGACGIDAPVKMTGVAEGVEVTPPVTMGCEGAEMFARWISEVVAPAARAKLGTVSRIATADAYSCRNRNQAASGRMSEHALGHAVDIAAVTIAGRNVTMAEGEGPQPEEDAFRATVRRGACSYFTTVLGPGSDASHKDHLHLDVIVRTSGYRLCQ
jgi:hypothetical protein